MAPSVVLAKAQRMAAARSSGVEGKGKGKRRMSEVEEVEDDAAIPSDEDEAVSDDDVDTAIAPAPAKRARLQSQSAENGRSDGRATTGTFKQKTLILSSRGITHRMRHMMKDIAALLPHSKTDAKLDTKHQLSLLNELADLSNCSSLLFFEARRHSELYFWASMTPNGPSVRFHLLNAHTMDELKMTGNCLKGSRPIVVFDKTFDESAHWRLMKEVLMQTFAAPKTARRAKPFVDHVTSFSVADGKIWFRNYQIVNNAPLDLNADGADDDKAAVGGSAKKQRLAKQAEDNMSMNEIGPRFVLVPIKIFEGSFGGAVVWENNDFMAPTAKAAASKYSKAVEYRGRKDAEVERKTRKEFLDAQEQSDRITSGRAALDKRRVFA